MSNARPKKAAGTSRRRRSAQKAPPARELHDVALPWGPLSSLRSVVRSPLGRQLLLVLPVAALPRLWAACVDQGVLWPDEIYQGPEQAHRLAFGYGFVPWEFQQGVRSWIYPGLLGLVFKGLSLLGVVHGLALMIAAKCLMALWALVGIIFAMKLAERLAGPSGSLAAGLLLATFPPSLMYDARCTTEAMTGPLIVAAAYFASEPNHDVAGRANLRVSWAAGGLAAIATALRPPNGLVLGGLFVTALVAKRWRSALHYAAAAGVVIALAGLLDAVTWGSPFHALVGYLHFNLREGKAAQFGVEPFTFYAEVAWTSVGLRSSRLVRLFSSKDSKHSARCSSSFSFCLRTPSSRTRSCAWSCPSSLWCLPWLERGLHAG